MQAEFFERFGFFVRPGLLSEEEADRLRDEMAGAAGKAATVAEGETADELDEGQRSTKWAQVSEETRSDLHERLLSLKPGLEAHFGTEFAGCQKPQFLVYREGDFFGAHHDTSDDEDVADFVRERRVSLVLFVNGQSDDPRPGTFGGGALTFYGLMDDARVGLPLDADVGLAVGFPSERLHAVSPVSHGERFTVVTWFH